MQVRDVKVRQHGPRQGHDSKIIDSAVEELKLIAGQAPVVSKAKKDIANYKLRKGHKIGVMVTLRGDRMWEFLDRLINVALPRVPRLRGVSSKGFDGRGNFTMGIREQIIFPEIEFDKIDSIKGLNSASSPPPKTDIEGRALLTHLGHAVPSGGSGARSGGMSKLVDKLPKKAQVQGPPPRAAASAAAGRARTSASSRCAACCFRELALRGDIPGVIKSSW
jgi:large subunit ribosomal protein L5